MGLKVASVVKAVDGLIIPEKIPGDDLRPEQIGSVADGLVASAKALRSGADEVTAGWAGLPAVFVAPDASVVYGAVAPASASAHVFAGKVDVIAKALHHYADGLGSVKRTLAAIKADAVTFRAKIGADGKVWMPPQQTKKYEWDSQAQVSRSQFGAGSAQDVVDYLRSRGETARIHYGTVQLRASWRESGDFIDQNNRLLDRVADAYATLNALEADCANTINTQRDDCVAEVVAVQGWQLKQSGANTADLPWGHRVDEDRNCGESFWWGAGNAGLGMVQGLGSLVSYNPTTNGWGDWDNAGKAWTGVGTGIGSLLLALSPVGTILAAAGVPLAQDAQTKTADMLKSLVAWDTWSKNPSEAAGAVLVNVGTFFIPGAGEVGGAIKALTIGTKLEIVASAITKVEAVTSKVTAVIPDTLTDLLTKLKTDHVDTHTDIDIPATIGAHGDTPGITIHTSSGDHAPDLSGGAIHDSGSTVVHDTRPSDTGAGSHHDVPDTGAPAQHDPQHPGDGSAVPPDSPSPDHPTPSVPPHDPPIGAGDRLDPAEAARRDPNTGNQSDGSWEGKGGLHLNPTDNAVVQQYAADAVTAEQQIRPDIQTLVEGTPDARLVGLDDSVKFADSLKDKVAKILMDNPGSTTSYALSEVKDSVRYTEEIPIGEYSDAVTHTVKGMEAGGYYLVKWSNTWENAGYKGINSSWIDPATGRTFELQFHTPESFFTKTLSHDLYKEMGVPGIADDILDQLEAESNQLFADLDVPPGAGALHFRVGDK